MPDDDGLLFPSGRSKRRIRALHRPQRAAILERHEKFIADHWPTLREHFANGPDVSVDQLRTRLELVSSGTWQANLFRLAAMTWSVPVSQGYGRRMRFLVWDDDNGKLIGLMALADPVFNLRVRDEWIGWRVEQRKERLVNVMDAYVLGAVPPYNALLGGKLVACLVRTTEIRDAFASKYADTVGIISNARKNPSLTLVTTTSALGRSSVYNRLVLDARRYFISLGYTSGWGHFHIPDSLFQVIRTYLAEWGHNYYNNHDFGDGPNWRLRAARAVLADVGLGPQVMHHGVPREVFACELAINARDVLREPSVSPDYSGLLSVAEVTELAKTRWLKPRAASRPEFAGWRRNSLARLLRPRTAGKR